MVEYCENASGISPFMKKAEVIISYASVKISPIH